MYDLELDKVVEEIKTSKAKRVCIQLPDGLKPKAKEIQEAIEAKTKAEVIIWGGSCFGACDLPRGLEELKVDLLIHFGHSPFKKEAYNV
ncbi:diphthamide synthesis protein [Candidatus Woesearchaeota archaeon]|nr:diphthamide synthesis protein [Candidatus Woesearchaeota archaeon]